MQSGVKPYLYIKRILDFIFALALLIIASPVMVLAAVAIKVEDPKGPVLFRQERPGKDTRIFKVNKFRTMMVATEKKGKKLSDKERLTKTGKFLRKSSVDELPQLINILKGEMSFIGPRPLLVKYLPYYTDQEKRRHEVLPGISGWAQVNGRNTISWNDKFRYDIEYIEKVSLIFDIKILFLTIYKIFKSSNISVDALPDLDEERSNKVISHNI
ncbi:lipopolysaccharide/colanic/teichoic acid biosynthesis glycosyltransferase [Desulfitispora alkaliphila]|uniref:sugar transferase n=1 Tax=Desulfitispora alkaliphila TaxID=622674 RepID=UPI003D1AE627